MTEVKDGLSEMWAECKRCGKKIQVDPTESFDKMAVRIGRIHLVQDCKRKGTRRWLRAFGVAVIAVSLLSAWTAWSHGSEWFILDLADAVGAVWVLWYWT